MRLISVSMLLKATVVLILIILEVLYETEEYSGYVDCASVLILIILEVLYEHSEKGDKHEDNAVLILIILEVLYELKMIELLLLEIVS